MSTHECRPTRSGPAAPGRLLIYGNRVRRAGQEHNACGGLLVRSGLFLVLRPIGAEKPIARKGQRAAGEVGGGKK